MGALAQAGVASPSERSAVVGKAVSRAADLLGLTNAALARAIGVSEATASRLRAGTYALTVAAPAGYQVAAAPASVTTTGNNQSRALQVALRAR